MLRHPYALLTLLLLFLVRPALSHDKWIEAEPSHSGAPSPTRIYLVTGEALQQAELLPLRRASSVVRFVSASSAGSRDLRGLLREDQQPIALLQPEHVRAGSTVIALDTAPVDIWLPAEKFQRYLFEERLMDVLALRARRGQEEAPGRERYSRSLKALVQVGPKPEDVALRPIGQELEILPLAHPHGLQLGGALAIKVLFRGKPLPGRAVTFANRYRSNVATRIVRTDENGQAAVPLERTGEWLIALVHMEPSAEPDADWRSYWSSLSFALPSGLEKGKP